MAGFEVIIYGRIWVITEEPFLFLLFQQLAFNLHATTRRDPRCGLPDVEELRPLRQKG